MWKPTFSHGAGLGTIRTTSYKRSMERGKEGEREKEERKGRKGESRKESGHTRSFCDSSEEGLGSGRWLALHVAGVIAQASF